jgi:hypothetical protein
MAPKDDDDSSPLVVTPDDSSSPLAVAPYDSSSLLAVAAPDDSDAPKLVPSSLLDSEASKIIGSTPSESMAIDFLPDSEVVPVVAAGLGGGAGFVAAGLGGGCRFIAAGGFFLPTLSACS